MLTTVIRALGSAWRALKLYPAGSPMTYEVAAQACAAIEEYLQAEPSLRLDVVREGFILRGLDGVLVAPGVADLADALALHGIGEVHFTAPPEATEMLALLQAVDTLPLVSQEHGGVQAALNRANAGSIRVVAVQLAKVEAPPEIPEEEAEKFLQELAGDPDRLAQWLRSLLSADDEGLTEGILLLADAAGDVRVFGRTLALAFEELNADDRDRLLESSIHLEALNEVLAQMIANLSATELTAAIRGGRYGQNLLSISYALTAIPLGKRMDEVIGETEAALRAADVSEAEIGSLRQMIERRRAGEPELPLSDSQPYYRAALQAISLTDEQRSAVNADAASHTYLDEHDALVLLYVLDGCDNRVSYGAVLGAIARAVPRLFESGAHDLAIHVVSEIVRRSASTEKAWPGLDVQFASAVEVMSGGRSMHALLAAYATDPASAQTTKQLVALGGEHAARSIAAACIESDAEQGMELAEIVVGRRLAELLAPEAPRVDAEHAARLAELLARDGGPWCMQSLGQMLARTEDKVRMETVRGIASAGGPAAAAFLPRVLRDVSPTVASFSARLFAKDAQPEVVAQYCARLDELEDDKDLTVAREIIKVLAMDKSQSAEESLRRAADRGGLLRKGRSQEIRQLAAQALKGRDAKEAS